jgi:hypothetical protein
MINFLCQAQPQKPTLIVFENSTGESGLKNSAGKVIVAATYSFIEFDKAEGVYIVQTKPGKPVNSGGKGKWGILNANGASLVAPRYDNLMRFNFGLIGASLDNKFGYIDKKGNVVVPFKYESGSVFLDNGLAIVVANKKTGCIDTKGNEVIPFAFDGIKKFNKWPAPAKKNDKWGYIDHQGKTVIEFQYQDAWDFQENGLAFATTINKGKGGIDSLGREMIPFAFDDIRDFKGGIAPAKFLGSWGYIDQKGKPVIKFEYDDAESFQEIGLAIVTLNNKRGCIDKTGKTVISTVFDDLENFSEELAPAMKNDKWGFINLKGQPVIPFRFDFVSAFENGKAVVYLNGDEMVIDKTGKVVLD